MNGKVVLNAVIEKADITTGERGFLDAWLTLNYGGSGQGFGGFVLYLPKSFTHHKLESCAGHFIFRCMEIAGVDDWSKMPGRTIRVRKEDQWGRIIEIGHIIKDDWFNPENDFKPLRSEEQDAA